MPRFAYLRMPLKVKYMGYSLNAQTLPCLDHFSPSVNPATKAKFFRKHSVFQLTNYGN